MQHNGTDNSMKCEGMLVRKMKELDEVNHRKKVRILFTAEYINVRILKRFSYATFIFGMFN